MLKDRHDILRCSNDYADAEMPFREKRIHEVNDAYVEPYHFQSDPPGMVGGPEAALWLDATRIWPPSDIPPKPLDPIVPIVTGRSLYAGPVWNHFGHILCDSLHRLWALHADDFDRIVFAGVVGLRGVDTPEQLKRSEIPDVAIKIMEAIGLPKLEMMLVREPVRFEHLYVPEPGSRIQEGALPWYFDHLRLYQDHLERHLPSYVGPRSVYYSRRHLLWRGGTLGSSHFAKLLARDGFVEVQPETLSIKEQFNMVLNADRVVFDEGSAVHIIEVLARCPGKFFMFPRRPNDRTFRMSFQGKADLVSLVEDKNIKVLPCLKGGRGPTVVATYPDLAEISQSLRRYSLLKRAFRIDRFNRRERRDMDVANSLASSEISVHRTALLLEIQSKRDPNSRSWLGSLTSLFGRWISACRRL